MAFSDSTIITETGNRFIEPADLEVSASVRPGDSQKQGRHGKAGQQEPAQSPVAAENLDASGPSIV